MSWVNKAHKQNRIDKQVKDIINSKAYQEELRKHDVQAVLNAMVTFSLFGCEFLEQECDGDKELLHKMVKFIRARTEEMGTDEEYHKDAIAYYKENFDIDVPKELNVEMCF